MIGLGSLTLCGQRYVSGRKKKVSENERGGQEMAGIDGESRGSQESTGGEMAIFGLQFLRNFPWSADSGRWGRMFTAYTF